MRVLDVAAGTGNASIPAAERGASVTASDLTPELLEAGRRRAEAEGVELDWVEADAENLPFDDESFDVVMSSIGAMFAPHHQDVADELVRVCRPGGTIGAAELDARGHDRRAVPDDGPVRPAAAARRAAAAAVGQRGARARAVRRPRRVAHARARRSSRSPPSSIRATTASTSRPVRPDDRRPGQRRAKDGREEEFDEALDQFCDEWNRGTADDARFEQEYLVAVGDAGLTATPARRGARRATRRQTPATLRTR